MKLDLSYSDLSSFFNASLSENGSRIDSVSYDSRKIIDGKHSLFFTLKGELRDGHDFIEQAYRKGIRLFVVEAVPDDFFQDAQFIIVKDSLKALQSLAKYHRLKFDYPLVAITGSAGKTIVKEWLSQLLSSKYHVVKSPKSYNSQLGVALSLLELTSSADIAIIEVGISAPSDMSTLVEMVQPDYGLFTSLGSAHKENFESQKEHLNEKMQLFKNVKKVFVHDSIDVSKNEQIEIISNDTYSFKDIFNSADQTSISNASLAMAMAKELGIDEETLKTEILKLQPIALRQETFDGIKNSFIINDTYSLDIDSFRSSLEYQLSISNGRKRVVIVGGLLTNLEKEEIKKLTNAFNPLTLHFISSIEEIVENIQDSVILIKGNRSLNMSRNAQHYRLKKHKTYVEIDLNAIRKNISLIKKGLPLETKILTMVKASSYGAGIQKIGLFLERIGVNYLGVAYVDEGVELRKAGVNLPILVMNAEEEGFNDCIENNLEPSIYSLSQFDAFIKALIYFKKTEYPVHIKIETGMNRLGFTEDEIHYLITVLKSQPEVFVKSVYSHLANAYDLVSNFTQTQVNRFVSITEILKAELPYSFERHILNSDGAINHPQYHFDMVRIGIGMYGYSSKSEFQKLLIPSIAWYSSISQIKKVKKGESVGYNCSETMTEDTTIAIIPVGYADGFRRSLSMGKGGVYIDNKFCQVLGNVCMDMIMVNVNHINVSEGDSVEIIGGNQSIYSLSEKMNTIPYEILTGISSRVHRIYIED